MNVAPKRIIGVGAAVLFAISVSILWTSRAALFRRDPANVPSAATLGAVLSPKTIAATSLAATVQIRSIDALGNQRGDGSGFFVASDGLIATSLHVIAGAYRLEAWTLYGKSLGTVRFVAADARRDLALLRVPVSDARALTLSRAPDPEIGEAVFVTGNPYGQTGTFTDGLVSALRPSEGVTFIQISAPVGPGSSGGPVTNNHGEVIGVTTLRLVDGRNVSYAIPVRYLRELQAGAPVPIDFERRLLPKVTRPWIHTRGVPDRWSSVNDDDWKLNVVDRQFRRADSLVSAIDGKLLGKEIRDSLVTADSTERTITFAKGREFLLVGFCDAMCRELSLRLIAPDGRTVDADLDVDYSPMLRAVAPASGSYRLRIVMSDCDGKRCGFGVRIYGVPSGTGTKRP